MPDFAAESTLTIHNPAAGRPAARRRAAVIVSALRRRGYEIRQTRDSGHATALASGALAGGAKAIVVLGGDGTLCETLNGLPPEIPIAFCPTGTVNLLARGLGLPQDPPGWMSLFDAGSTRSIYLGRVNERVFASVASVGFDARVVKRVSPHVKRLLHESAFVLTAMVELTRYRPPQLRVLLDGRRIDAPLVGVLLGKGPYYGGAHRLLPGAAHESPDLEAGLLEGLGRGALLRYAFGLGFGTLARQRGFRLERTREVLVDSAPPVEVQADGEPAGMTPARFTVEPLPRRFLAPAGHPER
jgi:YegS/Rv2252/BmrU family lipid kinase